MAKDPKRRAQIKAYKRREQEAFLNRLPFEARIFWDLFAYLDTHLGTTKCQRDFRLTTAFLETKDIPFAPHRDFFIDHGGGCDCEVLFNVQDAFPSPAPRTPRPQTPKRKRLDALELEGLRITHIPAPWRLIKTGDDYTFFMGKKTDIHVAVLPSPALPNDDDESWPAAWTQITDLPLEKYVEVRREQVGDVSMVTVKTGAWVPVLTWAWHPRFMARWCLRLRSELPRHSGDMQAFRQLLTAMQFG